MHFCAVDGMTFLSIYLFNYLFLKDQAFTHCVQEYIRYFVLKLFIVGFSLSLLRTGKLLCRLSTDQHGVDLSLQTGFRLP